jgi:hypothetical protein
VSQDQGFGLASVFGYTGTNTQIHSVARVLPNAGPPGTAAALNVLADDCETLTAKGGGSGGFVFVGPVLDDNGNVVAPGSIAVESSANACGGGNTAIDVTGNNVICASRSAVTATTCTGDGVILDHALDPGGKAGSAYSGTTAQLRPTPIAEQGTESYIPVTKHYGCNALSNCQPPATNYIRSLVTAYGGTGIPTSVYSASHSPYSYPYASGFVDRSSTLCSAISTVVIVPAGNNYAGCSLNIQGSGTLIVQGGTLVIDGGIQNSGCLVMNTAVTACPAGVVNGGTAQVTTAVRPTSDAIVFLRGRSCAANKCFDNSGSLVFPQTFVYSQATISPLNQAGNNSALTLWTAPDAGERDGNGRTALDNACLVPASGSVDPDCLDSRFARMTYWSEATFPTSNPNVFIGQGNLNVVGVFFTPLAAFKFSGGSGYASAAAQFWSAYLTVGGGAQLGISPIDRFSLPPLGPHLALIR